MSQKYRIGIDVGGTNTDAVLLTCTLEGLLASNRQSAIVAWHKSPTTPNVTDGIASSLKAILDKSRIERDDILYLSIGTTHFLNAVVEGDSSRLSKVAVIRLAGPYTARCPPFIDFPTHLRSIVEGHVAIIDGGLEVDGKEIKPVREDQVREQCEIIRSKGIRNVVIVGVFSPLASAGSQEEHVKRIIEDTLNEDNVNVVCSKDVGHIGLLERENAAILNSAVLNFARRTIRAYQDVLKKLDLKCPLYLTQLDGTLVAASVAALVPIRTFSNGPTNSMRGAAFLAGLDKKRSVGETRSSVIVVDVGGTTTDVGVLLPSGFPRKAAAFTEVGGVRTNFSMPDIYSIGLGGGSRVRYSPSNTATIGPDSVGLAICSSSIIFGSTTLTATDLAAAAGMISDSGIADTDFSRMQGVLTDDQIHGGISVIKHMLESAVDKMKTDPGDVTLLLVGGGSIIVPDNLAGVKEVIRPPFHEVANAVGAAIARVSGVVDRVEIPGTGKSIEDIVESCKAEAINKAIESGAQPSSIEVTEVTVIQLPYVANHASRIIIRAIGDLDFASAQKLAREEYITSLPVDEPLEEPSNKLPLAIYDNTPIYTMNYRPNVSSNGVWTLTETDMEWIADGCALLGCGGGGATYPAFLMARESVRKGHKIRVVSAEYFKDQDVWVLPCGFMGSPSVSTERIPSGQEIPSACTNLTRYLGVESMAAIISDEIGGKNGLEPMLLASLSGFDLPVVDGDLMGRAYPKLHQILPCVFKENGLFPVAAADGVGNCMIVPSASSNPIVEDILRAACTVLGSSIALSICPLRARELEQVAITGTTSQAWRIGRAIAWCRKTSNVKKVAESVTQIQGGKCLFVGKIVEVKREVRGGFTHGQITIARLVQDELESEGDVGKGGDQSPNSHVPADVRDEPASVLVVPFQNENLCARLVRKGGESESVDSETQVLCTVPDLIAVLDSQNGSSIGTQDYRYGLRVTVVGIPCDPRWTTPKGLEIGGPEAFGLGVKYTPIGKYIRPKSVIEEYRGRV